MQCKILNKFVIYSMGTDSRSKWNLENLEKILVELGVKPEYSRLRETSWSKDDNLNNKLNLYMTASLRESNPGPH